MRKTGIRLNDIQKIEIVSKYLAGNITCVQLSKEYNVSKSAIGKLLKRRNVTVNQSKANRRYSINEHYFDVIDTEDKAYFLGLLYADGYNYEYGNEIVLSLQYQDKDILEKFNFFINSNKPLGFRNRSIKHKNHQDISVLSIRSKHMSNRLSELGCFQNKSLTLQFPNNTQVPQYLLNHFIRGYNDGDGSFNLSKNNQISCCIVSTCDFCYSLKYVIKNTINVNSYIYQCKASKVRNTTTRDIYIGGNIQALKFLNWIYNNATIYLNRKYIKYQTCKNSLLTSKNISAKTLQLLT